MNLIKTFTMIADRQLMIAELSELSVDFANDFLGKRDQERWFYFNQLYVPHGIRGKGLSKDLLQQVAALADQEKVTIVNELNPYGTLDHSQLIALCSRFGFTQLAENLVVRRFKP